MNKKNLLVAAALPLFVAACSSEDVLVEPQGNNQYDGIAKVDAKFNLGETESRLATQWGIEAGKDILGFAWLGVDNNQGAQVGMNGLAYQNHPLFAATAGSFQPETSIYVGKYYTYHPYDYNTKSIKAVEFTVEKQDMLSDYNDLAKTSIWISPKWTNVTLEGDRYGDDKAGVDQTFNIYPRQFSNYANLFMTYLNNEPITGAPEVKSIKVSYLNESGKVISINKFAYAPTEEEYTGTVSAANNFWSNYTMIDGAFTASAGSRADAAPESVNGVDAEEGAITLTPATEYIATGESYRVRYNALPAISEVTAKTVLKVEIETTYGKITYPCDETELEDNQVMTLDLIAKTQLDDGTWKDFFDGEKKEDGTLAGVDPHESFVQRPYKTGRFDFSVDFFDAVMDGMHVEDNAQLMKMLTFYKTYKTPAYMDGKYVETGVDLYLDADANKEFKISKKALALVQEINGGTNTGNIALHPCDRTCGENVVAPKIVVFNEADAEDEDYKEVPTFGAIFGSNVDIYLDDQDWTWNSNAKKNTGRVKTIFNRGDLEINATTVNAGNSTIFKGIENTAAAKITVKSVANVKIDLVNKGKITVNPNAELLAYNSTITNEATSLRAFGEIDNDGVIGVVENTTGVVNNYGYIHNDADAKTYITANETVDADFTAAWSSTNKIGTIELTDKFDNVSVMNATEDGFIKYTWDGGATYVTPTPEEDVKYNYLIVKDNLEFIDKEEEIKFLEIANTGKEIVLRSNKDNAFANQELRGFVMQAGAKVNIKTKNKIQAEAAYITGSRVYVGGEFIYNQLTSYLGGNNKDTDCIVIYE